MKILFISILSILCSLVVNLEGASIPKAEKYGTTNRTKSKLCLDESGNPIYGLVAYKLDCSKFVQCGYGTENVAQCQPGLTFNVASASCDWPRQANCIEFRSKDPTKLVIPESDIIW